MSFTSEYKTEILVSLLHFGVDQEFGMYAINMAKRYGRYTIRGRVYQHEITFHGILWKLTTS